VVSGRRFDRADDRRPRPRRRPGRGATPRPPVRRSRLRVDRPDLPAPYVGTRIEHEFEQAGVALLAADEGIDARMLPSLADGSIPAKRATPTLTRRVKQAIAEWYVLNMLELSWGGLKTHTDQGFNIGKPPYGYGAVTLRHPVAAKAAEGKVKRRLVPDPVQGPVVTTIFQWRALERLSYQAIADRLNTDPGRYPPPEPIPGQRRRRVGAWTLSSVREVLDNPKHTGYMVWNRRKNARPDRGIRGQVNPPNHWVWSSRPTHEPLVTRDLFEAASAVGRFRERSRFGSTPNRHPATTRTYTLRSYLICDICGRRLWGNEKKKVTYYHCRIKTQHAHKPWYPQHPPVVTIREDVVQQHLAGFFARRVFGANRRLFLAHAPDQPHTTTEQARIAALKAQLTELQRRQDNLVRELEAFSPSGDAELDTNWRTTLQKRFVANAAEQRTLTTDLADAVRQAEQATPNPHATDLIDTIPQHDVDITLLPEKLQRALYDVFHLEVRYDPHANRLTLRVTVSEGTATALANVTKNRDDEPSDDHPPNRATGPDSWGICWEPPVGIEPTTYSLRVNRSGRLS
jgi:site-specific DNA recombinase